MKKAPELLLAVVVACLWAPALASAQDAAKKQSAARDVGAVLAWRLGPELLEETCRSLDPEGAEARAKLLKEWLDKNATLIKAVDDRVAEVVPLAYPAPPNVDAVTAVRAQVRKILEESMFEGKSPESSKEICRVETDPTRPRWSNTGMRGVQQSLAELYDWKVSQGAK